MLDQVSQMILLTGGSVVALIGVLMLFRKFWSYLSQEHLNSIQNSAQSALYMTLRQEIDHMRQEIANVRASCTQEMENMRKAHSREREELLRRIKHLEDILNSTHTLNESIKRDAIQILDHLDSNISVDYNDEVYSLLKRIVNDIDSSAI